jgi:hypothetical protein
MNEQLPIDAEVLIDEITRYLAVVEVFRAVDCEPTWRPESASLRADAKTATALVQHAPTAH